MKTKNSGGATVGAIIFSADGKMLMIERRSSTPDLRFIGGHVDPGFPERPAAERLPGESRPFHEDSFGLLGGHR